MPFLDSIYRYLMLMKSGYIKKKKTEEENILNHTIAFRWYKFADRTNIYGNFTDSPDVATNFRIRQ